jgi:hypothetical protein
MDSLDIESLEGKMLRHLFFSLLCTCFNLKLKVMETTYTLYYTRFEPNEAIESKLEELTGEELASWLYTLKEGDFGCSFGDFRIEEH